MTTSFTYRATLAALPTEIIYGILEHVLPEDLENFAGTCRTTTAVAQPALKIHRELVRRYRISRNDPNRANSLAELGRELAVDRNGRYVMRLQCSIWLKIDDSALNLFLSILPNLRALYLDLPPSYISRLGNSIFKAPHSAEPILPSLREVYLRCTTGAVRHGFQVELLLAISALPSLNYLTESDSDLISETNFGCLWSNLVRLELWNCHIHMKHIENFLRSFTQLRSFGFSSPLPGYERGSGVIDAALIVKGLLNSRSTLRNMMVVAPRRKTSPMDSLTEFRYLESLRIDLELLPSPDLGDDGVPRLQLPSSLRELEIQCIPTAVTEYVRMIEIAVSRKTSDRRHLRVFTGLQEAYKFDMQDLVDRCKAVGILLSCARHDWQPDAWEDLKKNGIHFWISPKFMRTLKLVPVERATLFPTGKDDTYEL